METQTAKSCPRCGQPFTCSAESIRSCECMTLPLTTADLAFIRAYTESAFGQYTCLCPGCLRALQAERAATVS